MSNERFYFIYPFQLDDGIKYMIWYEGKKDGLLVNPEKRVFVFNSFEAAMNFDSTLAVKQDLNFTPSLDLDKLKEWLEVPNKETIHCELFLNAWNLFTDFARSIENEFFDYDLDKSEKVYNKLFFGNNLSSVTPEGEHYTPEWLEEEIKQMKEILDYGLNMFKNSMVFID